MGKDEPQLVVQASEGVGVVTVLNKAVPIFSPVHEGRSDCQRCMAMNFLRSGCPAVQFDEVYPDSAKAIQDWFNQRAVEGET
jgi:hypothetical protein